MLLQPLTKHTFYACVFIYIVGISGIPDLHLWPHQRCQHLMCMPFNLLHLMSYIISWSPATFMHRAHTTNQSCFRSQCHSYDDMIDVGKLNVIVTWVQELYCTSGLYCWLHFSLAASYLQASGIFIMWDSRLSAERYLILLICFSHWLNKTT